MLAAFSGWNDAGDAATEATKHLRRRFRAGRVATIDPEYFYDFASVRPNVRLSDGERRIDWPRPEVRVGELDNGDPVVTLLGVEPRLRWRTFSEVVVSICETLGVTKVATLGALLTGTHHKAPVNVVGASSNSALNLELGLRPSTYEGPTGIIGVLNDACHRAGLVSVSFWAAVPTYVSSYPSPKAALALVERVAKFLDSTVDGAELASASATYDEHIDEVVANDDRLAQYAQQILEDSAAEAAEDFNEMAENPEALVNELERFLRQEDD
ncbi:MAG TPA: carboxylate--amine ligase [Acidimicrobiaceae bacterium]|nr:carboxylate--amine ligase [Acidimicrobiaceae bacterium]HCB36820.1 carboxylate--amine ligase [Acidimicrobiaceae bacterium]